MWVEQQQRRTPATSSRQVDRGRAPALCGREISGGMAPGPQWDVSIPTSSTQTERLERSDWPVSCGRAGWEARSVCLSS